MCSGCAGQPDDGVDATEVAQKAVGKWHHCPNCGADYDCMQPRCEFLYVTLCDTCSRVLYGDLGVMYP